MAVAQTFAFLLVSEPLRGLTVLAVQRGLRVAPLQESASRRMQTSSSSPLKPIQIERMRASFQDVIHEPAGTTTIATG